MKMMNYALLFAATLLLSSCSLFSPVKTETSSVYLLTAVPSVGKRTPHATTILVSMPDTRPIYNTTQMAYTTKTYQVSYFAQNQWAETPAQMLQPLIVQTLQNSRFFRAVAMTPFVGKYDYLLNTQILVLQQDFTHLPNTVDLIVKAQLISAYSARVIATKDFRIHENIFVRSPYGGVIAANEATARFLRELNDFCIEKIK